MKTCFYDCHVKYGGKVVDFHGWDLPIQFQGIIAEHETVRNHVGLFDVSHMGEFLIEGRGALEFADYCVTNDVLSMEDNSALYTPMCREDGTTVDDLLVYRFNPEKILMVVNAANIDKDFAHVSMLGKESGLSIKNVSSEYAQLALQGPKAAYVINDLIKEDPDSIGFFCFIETEICGVPVVLSRTGYTQEDGFEIYFTNLEKAGMIWDEIMEKGSKYSIAPIGLGARDTLRFEGGLMLYGNDLDDTTTPLQARLQWAVCPDRDFHGRDALLKEKEEGIHRRLCGLEMLEKGIARNGYEVSDTDGNRVGHITSGTKSPTLGKILALAYVRHPFWKKNNELLVSIRGKKNIKAKTVKYPFYKKPALTMVNNCSKENS